jgi:cytochrome c oxidase subunit 2
LIWDDPNTHDDIVTSEMYLEVNKPVKLIIGSRDVIHDVGLVYFRQKMDAVPGTPTTMWFIPRFTTEEMKKKLGNPDFVYEISCDQMCGRGHYTMRGVITVVTHEQYVLWLAKQKANYAQVMGDQSPAPAGGGKTDSTKAAAVTTTSPAAAKLVATN